jgi:hypothetical protein
MIANENGLAVAKRAYDEYLEDLFGNAVPLPHFRQSLASAFLYMAGAEQQEWEHMAQHTGSSPTNLLRQRSVLVHQHQPDA